MPTIGDELLEQTSRGATTATSGTRYLDRSRTSTTPPNNAVLQHLQPVPVRDVDHGERRGRATAHIKDTIDLYDDIAERLASRPFSFVKPSGLVDGHPASSKLDLFEGFSKKIVDAVQANPSCGTTRRSSSPSTKAAATTTRATSQPLDFFGDGTRIPLIVVSPYAKGGHVSHDVHRPRLDPEVHRAQLEPARRSRSAAATTCRTRCRRARTRTRRVNGAGDRRPVRYVRFRASLTRAVGNSRSGGSKPAPPVRAGSRHPLPPA